MRYLFYRSESQTAESTTRVTVDSRYSFGLWRPSLAHVIAPGTSYISSAIWWTMHQLHAFANRDYGVFIICYADNVVHRTGVYPPYFRFPFMSGNDLQIGNTWTEPEHRGRGLATFAIRKTFEWLVKPDRRFWYVVEENNNPSIRVIEKAGFVRIGEGVRNRRLGLRLLGSYVIQERYC